VVAPLFHILACGMQGIPALACGGTAVIAPAFEAGGWLRAIRDERIDVLNGVPAMCWQALRHPEFPGLDVSGVRLLSYGAAPTPPAQVRRLLEAFPAARMRPATASRRRPRSRASRTRTPSTTPTRSGPPSQARNSRCSALRPPSAPASSSSGDRR